MKKSDKIFLIVFSTLIVGGTYLYEHFLNNPVNYPLGKYRPIKNAHPKYFMTVKGWIDPGLYNTLVFKVEYYSTNDKCRVTINHIEGASIERVKTLTYKIHTKNHRFSKKLPLDYYKPGFCKWHIADISYSYWISKDNTIAFFKLNNEPTGIKEIGTGKLNAANASETLLFSHSDYRYLKIKNFSDNLTAPLKNNLTYTLILKKK